MGARDAGRRSRSLPLRPARVHGVGDTEVPKGFQSSSGLLVDDVPLYLNLDILLWPGDVFKFFLKRSLTSRLRGGGVH